MAFKSSRGDPSYSRFRTEAFSNVGSTSSGVASSGPGLAARTKAQNRTRSMSLSGNQEQADLREIILSEPTDSPNVARDVDYSREMVSDMEAWKKAIQDETQINDDPVEPESTPEAPTPNESFATLAEKLAKSANDPTFVNAVKDFSKKYNTTPDKVYGIINVESAWDPTVINEGGYSGLFQIGEDAARDAGIDYASLSTMTPTQQVAAYDKYLKYWKYDGSVSLGLMQAAPGLAKRLKGSPPTTVVYTVGSDAWNANPKWRSGAEGKGPVTMASLDKVYNQ